MCKRYEKTTAYKISFVAKFQFKLFFYMFLNTRISAVINQLLVFT